MNYTPVAEQNNVVNLFLPIINSKITGINIINIQVDNNNFLDVTLNAIIGPNSSISIIKPGINAINYNGDVNNILHLGSDISNKIPFRSIQNVNIVLNVAPNETIIINELSYKINVPINYKLILFIFLIIFFIINILT